MGLRPLKVVDFADTKDLKRNCTFYFEVKHIPYFIVHEQTLGIVLDYERHRTRKGTMTFSGSPDRLAKRSSSPLRVQ